jgi:hypothetical protein
VHYSNQAEHYRVQTTEGGSERAEIDERLHGMERGRNHDPSNATTATGKK